MLQATYPAPAVVSPCYDCRRMGHKDFYPDCATIGCRDINSYLEYLGLPPHQTDDQNYAAMNPVSRPKNTYRRKEEIHWTKRGLASKEETYTACCKLNTIRESTGRTHLYTCGKLKIPYRYYLEMARLNVNRMSAEYYDRIMAYEIK